MLLKVCDGNKGWVLFDNVDNVHLTSQNHEVSQATELAVIGGPDATILVPKDCFANGNQISVGVIEFTKNALTRKVLFTSVVYVCDDRGNTVDSISVKNGKVSR